MQCSTEHEQPREFQHVQCSCMGLIHSLEYLFLRYIRRFNSTTVIDNTGDSVSSLGGLNIGGANGKVSGKADIFDSQMLR